MATFIALCSGCSAQGDWLKGEFHSLVFKNDNTRADGIIVDTTTTPVVRVLFSNVLGHELSVKITKAFLVDGESDIHEMGNYEWSIPQHTTQIIEFSPQAKQHAEWVEPYSVQFDAIVSYDAPRYSVLDVAVGAPLTVVFGGKLPKGGAENVTKVQHFFFQIPRKEVPKKLQEYIIKPV